MTPALITAASLVAGLFAYGIARSVTRMACDCLREDCSCDCQPDQLRREVESVPVHDGGMRNVG